MRSFMLAVEGDGLSESKRIEFEADDPSRAFHILEREGIGRTATLSEGDKRLAVLKRASTGYWQFIP